MFRSLLILVAFILTSTTSSAQFYSGKFLSKPSLKEFQHFIVMENAQNDAFGGKLNVKAFSKTGEIWHGPAQKVNSKTFKTFANHFASEIDLKSAYRLQVKLSGEAWDYYMLGFMSKDKKLNYKIVEETFHYPEDVIEVSVDTFIWENATVRK